MTKRTIDEYLALPYHIEVIYDASGEEPGWVARVVELPGCLTQANSFEGAGTQIREAMRGWIEIALEDGHAVPEPHPVEGYSGKFVTRVPRSLHRQLAEAAEQEGVSLNAFVSVALAKAVGQPANLTGPTLPAPTARPARRGPALSSQSARPSASKGLR